jgi:MoxR-like ATPase
MTPSDLSSYLNILITQNVNLALMLWGPPGVGKSSIVQQVAQHHTLEFIDLRLSQLAPTDLRGLPVPENGISKWFPPEFLPTTGRGILFLDELNMAPPAMQGMAQQLILDRKVGSYTVPDGWFIWAAGNRKEDRASVFDMPAPLANRFIHLSLEPDLDSFKAYALSSQSSGDPLNRGIHERILAFLSFRSNLLHKLEGREPAWPSPRSWVMASQLLHANLDLEPAVGAGAAAEFRAYCQLYNTMPDLNPILEGRGSSIPFPSEPSVRYAATLGLTVRVRA